LFFNPSTVVKTRGFTSLLPKCGACGLLRQCNTPKMEVDGDGRLGMLVVGESPGREEDEQGRPFVGPTGRVLRDELRRNNVDIRRDCWLTNAAICHPPEKTTSKHVECCRPNLTNTIRELRPRVILLLGGHAVTSFIRSVWKDEDIGGMTKWAGWRIPCRDPDAWVCPTFHPSYILHSEKKMELPAIQRVFARHIRRACKLAHRGKSPWNGNPPDESKDIYISLSPNEAASLIRRNMEDPKRNKLTSFDYETNMLKPDGDDAEIVSCSICFNDKFTVAYPWHGAAIDATIEYLKSDIPKCGANMKFEERWSRAKHKTRVRNWVWDMMVQAHTLDHRRGITSVKFQSFVRFGTPAWDLQVAPYLKSSAPDKPNRIRECDLETLLIYNGIDSLVEFRGAIAQSKVVGITLPGTRA
jgi:uracil-DNA glycosylase family 4